MAKSSFGGVPYSFRRDHHSFDKLGFTTGLKQFLRSMHNAMLAFLPLNQCLILL